MGFQSNFRFELKLEYIFIELPPGWYYVVGRMNKTVYPGMAKEDWESYQPDGCGANQKYYGSNLHAETRTRRRSDGG